MKIFNNKKMLFKLIVALCIFLTLVSFGMPSKVQADWIWGTTKGAAEQGGKLLAPVIDLVLALGDGVIDILQQAVMGTESAITIDTALKIVRIILTALAALVVIVAVTILLGPVAAALGPVLSTIAVGAVGVLKIVAGGAAAIGVYTAMSSALPDITVLPTYSISPEEIFKGEILLFDVNIFNPKQLYIKVTTDSGEEIMTKEAWESITDKTGYEVKHYLYYKDGNSSNTSSNNIIVTSANNSAAELKTAVAKWYYTIRNIAIVALMLILLYVGIRILISSTASEKSKYKQMLGDWIVAMCLLFVMQYIMVFANNITESITLLLSSVADEGQHIVVIKDADVALKEGIEEVGLNDAVQGNDVIWPTNLMGKARLLAEEQNGTTGYVGYALCYLVLVVYTVIFTITYAKRLLYLIFFTIIAPLVAVTYPIDKINDGKAQAFNIWLREYIFNLLIQPFHLLLYTVLISTAFDLAGTNIIYSLVAIGFMIPAEKFLRKMFGFDKASTPGFLEGAAGAAMAMHGLQSLQKIAGKGPGGKGKTGSGKDDKDPGKIDFMNRGADSGFKTADLLGDLGLGDRTGSGDALGSRDVADSGTGRIGETVFTDSEGEGEGAVAGTDALSKYEAEGFGKNADGEYYNPYTDEFDADYDPTKDPEYAGVNTNALSKYEAEGFGKNADGEYYNPYTDEYDADYDPTKDQTYAGVGLDTSTSPISTPEPEIPTSPTPMPDPEPLSSPTPEPESKGIKPWHHTLGKYAGARFTNWRRNNLNKENILRTTGDAVKTGAGLALGAAGGIIGTAAGIASGDLKSVSQNLVGGAYAGSAIGRGVATRVIDSQVDSWKRAKANHEEALKEMYGDNYSQYIKGRKDKMFKKDGEMRKLYSREFSDQIKNGEKLEDIMEAAVKYRQYGVTDNGTIIKAMKMDSGAPSNWTDKERIAAAKLSGVSKSEKDLEATMKRFAKTPGITSSQVKAMERRIRKINDL